MRLPPREQRDVLKIGELAEQLATTPRTIRLYEELGVIVPARTEAGTRLYARKDMKRMEIALTLSRCGVDLETIGRLATLRDQYETGSKASKNVLPELTALKTALSDQIERLTQLEHDIAKASDLIGHCRDCPNRPNRQDCPHCEVDKQVESSDIARLIWDPDTP
ncbi:MerR family transcriptional regulator [Methylomonas sp. EFPC1]|uniref:MerR family transcriptional regulator n=1 Tax=unclassified Methylomonas TaxID=2608980 RepID=UPI00196858CA|nr:MerR family transcriptional regulator [Methylomonas sp. EFPC1]QSA99805.1 MerR family transcriptional regulator [Methylomonas sp. EFPC1]